jgi:hypothetical protein
MGPADRLWPFGVGTLRASLCPTPSTTHQLYFLSQASTGLSWATFGEFIHSSAAHFLCQSPCRSNQMLSCNSQDYKVISKQGLNGIPNKGKGPTIALRLLGTKPCGRSFVITLSSTSSITPKRNTVSTYSSETEGACPRPHWNSI